VLGHGTAYGQRGFGHYRLLLEFQDGGAQRGLGRIGRHHHFERFLEAADRTRVELRDA